MGILDVVAARFGDRPVPDDLQALVALPPDAFEQVEIEFTLPGHRLLGHAYLTDNDRANPETMANVAAIEEVSRHAIFVLADGDDNLWGYWLPEKEPPVVCYSSEGQFSIESGTLTEAIIAAHAFDEEAFAELAQEFIDAGVPVAARRPADLVPPAVETSPAGMHDRLYRTLRGI